MYIGALNGGGGGIYVTCQILKTALSHVIVTRKMALLFVPYILMSHVKFKKSLCRVVELLLFKNNICVAGRF